MDTIAKTIMRRIGQQHETLVDQVITLALSGDPNAQIAACHLLAAAMVHKQATA